MTDPEPIQRKATTWECGHDRHEECCGWESRYCDCKCHEAADDGTDDA